MNKEQQELLDEAYENYLKGGHIKWLNQMEVNTPAGKMNIPVPYTQEQFINKCKTDTEFFERWGLKIEERELSFEERCEIQIARLEGMYSSGKEVFIQHSVNDVKQITMDKNNIPTKQITITYNNKTIESYEN
jgi:cytochrome c biogenesis protein ResB